MGTVFVLKHNFQLETWKGAHVEPSFGPRVVRFYCVCGASPAPTTDCQQDLNRKNSDKKFQAGSICKRPFLF